MPERTLKDLLVDAIVEHHKNMGVDFDIAFVNKLAGHLQNKLIAMIPLQWTVNKDKKRECDHAGIYNDVMKYSEAFWNLHNSVRYLRNDLSEAIIKSVKILDDYDERIKRAKKNANIKT